MECTNCEYAPFPEPCPEGFEVAVNHAGYVKRCKPCQMITRLNTELHKAQRIIKQAYGERNALVCALSKIWHSHLAEHPVDPKWDPEWLNVVCIHSPVGQLSWHIHISELPNFEHLKMQENDWDGHTTEEKYLRLQELKCRLQNDSNN